MNKKKIGIFLHFDFSVGGILNSEILSYNDVLSHPNIEKLYVFDYKGKYAEMCKDFTFEYTRVIVSNLDDVEKFNKCDILFTWDGYQDFFAGTISPKAIEIYKMMSKITNELNKKVYFRICDSRHFMKDYKKMIADRGTDTDSGRKFIQRNSTFFNSLDNIKSLNYENIYFLCNGSRSVKDWSWITLTHSMDFLSKEFVQQHSVYISDDILFRYSEYYNKLNYLTITDKIDNLYHVGNLNSGKVGKIKAVMKNCKVPLILRTPPRSINNGLKSTSSITMLEEPIYKEAMYVELNKYNAYLFVGKGDDKSVYFNKTLYDASAARTVFLIYSKIDTENLYHELSEYVFTDEKDLVLKYEWIKQDYQKHLDRQREVLLKNLSSEVLSIFDTE